MEFEKGKLEWLEFDRLDPHPEVVHGVFERHGGVSTGPFASLNLSTSRGDQPNCVKVNRDRIAQALGVPHLVFPHCNHGADIARITKDNVSKTPQADAVFTTEKQIGLAVTHADCQAAIFFDPKQHAVGIAHAGWRGNVQNIYGKLIDAMKQQLGTHPKDLIVCISPSLGPDHAEFKNFKEEFPEEFWRFETQKPFHFDLWALAKSQLQASGVPAKQIEIASICTYCTPKDYYSHRRDPDTGRNATVVALK